MDPARPAHERYRVLGRIAQGAATEILLARAIARDGSAHEVALRRPLEAHRRDSEFTRVLHNEARLASLLEHPSIAMVHEVGEEDGVLFIAMELVLGATLERVRRRLSSESRRLPLTFALRVAMSILDALEFAHECVDVSGRRLNFVHLDVCPKNIVVGFDGRPKLTNFGMALPKSVLAKRRAGLGRGAASAYVAPEQIEGGQVGARSDLYSVAQVLYEIALGRHPFGERAASEGPTFAHDPVHPTQIDAHFPEPLAEVLLRALRRDPLDRFASARDMKLALTDACRQGLEPARPEVLAWYLRELFEEERLLEAKARSGKDDKLLLQALQIEGTPASTSRESQERTAPIGNLVRDIDRGAAPPQPPRRASVLGPPPLPATLSPLRSRSETSRKGAQLGPLGLQTRDAPQPQGVRGLHEPDSKESSIQVAGREEEQGTVLTLTGRIDDTFSRRTVLSRIPRDTPILVLDMDGVQQITSYGVREWLAMLQELSVEYYCFTRCRPAIVAQFNMVVSFGGNGELISIYAPYVCELCNQDIEILVDLRRDRHMLTPTSTIPVTCPTCKGDADFDDIPESYFAYAAEMPAPSPPPGVSALIDGAPTAAPEPFRIRKEVEGTVTALWILGTLDRNARFKRLADGLEGVVVVDVSGVKSPTREGVTGFLHFLETAPLDIHLARITPEMALALTREGGSGLGRGKAVSARYPFRCSGCAWHGTLDIEAPFDWLKLGDPAQQLCHVCFDQLIVPAADPTAVDALVSMLSAVMPDEAREYLSGHARGPLASTYRTLSGEHRPAEGMASENADALGKYQFIKRLGCGGMAEVFLARQVGPRGFEKRVAVKRILPHLAEKAAFVDMFLREARVAARLSHPNIVQIFDLGQLNEHYFIAMEYVRGWDLARILQLCRRLETHLPVELACRITADICSGLHAAHSYRDDEGRALPIIHRDVSPHNVLISTEGVVKLTDFGIAKAADSVDVTSAGEVRGKVSYMAPERIDRRSAAVDARSDIFSAAVVLHEALALKPLFRRENKFQTVNAILKDAVPPLSLVRADVPPELDTILAQALARSPNERYTSAQDFQLKLESHLMRPVSTAHVSIWLRALFTRGVQLGQPSSELTLSGGSASTGNSTEELLVANQDPA